MEKSFYKYCLKVLSTIIVISFLNTNLGLCGLIIYNCSAEDTVCCCKTHENNAFPSTELEKECCCEIKEMSRQPAELNLGLNESLQKNILLSANIYSETETCESDFNLNNFRILSFHSPPKEKIHILNSNFRI